MHSFEIFNISLNEMFDLRIVYVHLTPGNTFVKGFERSERRVTEAWHIQFHDCGREYISVGSELKWTGEM